MTNKMSVATIVASEDSVLKQTSESSSLGTSSRIICHACDVLLKLMYELGPDPDPNTAEGTFRLIAFERYGEVPYTVRAIGLLGARGHYPESITLCRSLVESYVFLRYFAAHPEKLQPHLLATNAKGRVKFVEMFDEVAEGFYGRIYGQLLSGVAHSGMALSALLPVQAASDGTLAKSLGRHGCEFRSEHAAFVVNVAAAMLRGLLAHFATFFPKGTVPTELASERDGLVKILSEHTSYVMKGEMLDLFTKLVA